jgi:hypothetical protein
VLSHIKRIFLCILLFQSLSQPAVLRRNLRGLSEDIFLSYPDVHFHENQLDLQYRVSDSLVDNNVRFALYEDCQRGSADISSQFSNTSISSDTGIMTVFLSVVPDDLKDSPVYTMTGEMATLQFCCRLSAYDKDAEALDAFESTYSKSMVSLLFDISTNSIFDAVAIHIPKEEPEYAARVFQCDENLEELLSKTYVIGEEIRICFSPTLETVSARVYMRRIESFEFSKGKETRKAVTDGVESSNGMSQLSCTPGSIVCSMYSLFPSSMFSASGIVTGIGGVTLQYGDGDLSARLEETFEVQINLRVEGPHNNHPFKGVDAGDENDSKMPSRGILPLVDSTWAILNPVFDNAGDNVGDNPRDGAYNQVEGGG